MEENFLITETLFSCPQIKFEYEAKYQMQIYGLLSERQSSMLSVVWVKVIGASSSSTTHNRLPSCSPRYLFHMHVLIKLFLGYITWINSCSLATQATKLHK
ncbi:hypothetical protein CUMW_168710 [Citrus unshiu]|uniref:Uncharacterized protein n=1 Tax=Citrus unshiu TaxID=55188 RepID=A0A2H5PUL2_CITUN|nr:hypothetical protein CUMW_168710 [Citrus unshiu]